MLRLLKNMLTDFRSIHSDLCGGYMVRDSFAIFILSHGRANKVKTVNALKYGNYSGKWFILLDDEDEQIPEYKRLFGDEHIVIFSKAEYANEFDIMDNFGGNKVITYARNAVNHIARDMGLSYFWELEDDYILVYRPEIGKHLPSIRIHRLDDIIELFLNFLDDTNVKTVAFAQNGEMIGGVNGQNHRTPIKRKAMNSFFFKTDNLPDSPGDQFIGRMNDDVNWYTTAGRTGQLIFQTSVCCVCQPATQQNSGGISDVYKSFGTYVKSFYSVMLRPDCTKIYVLSSGGTSSTGNKYKKDARIHHYIDWEYCVPKIISSKYKK